MGLEQECLQSLVELYYLIEDPKEDKDFLHNGSFKNYKKFRIQVGFS